MDPFRKFVHLTSAEQALLARTTLVVALVRIFLVCVPFRRIPRLLRKRPFSMLSFRRTSGFSDARLVWGVRAAARLIPGATCLTQSLALQSLLGDERRVNVQIGVAKDGRDKFMAHAWVECDGTLLLGSSSEVAHYERLVILPPVPRRRPGRRHRR
jgi:transglutaminase superfamily protein